MLDQYDAFNCLICEKWNYELLWKLGHRPKEQESEWSKLTKLNKIK